MSCLLMVPLSSRDCVWLAMKSASRLLKLAVTIACAASSTAFVVPAPRWTPTVQQPRRARARALRASESLSPAERTWSARRKLARAAFDAQLGWNRIDDEAADEADAAGADAEPTSDAAANTVGTTAFSAASRGRDDFREMWGGKTMRNRHRHAW